MEKPTYSERHNDMANDDRVGAKHWLEMPDTRYDYVLCIKCGQKYQRIDFRSAAHFILCPVPQEAK